MKRNGIYIHTVYEKMLVLHYFRFVAEESIFFVVLSIPQRVNPLTLKG